MTEGGFGPHSTPIKAVNKLLDYCENDTIQPEIAIKPTRKNRGFDKKCTNDKKKRGGGGSILPINRRKTIYLA